MPSKQSNGYLNSWYSFNYAFIHIISLSCESDFPNALSGNLLDTTTQVNWLKKDLTAVNRSVTPWIVLQCHPPWKGSISLNNILEGGVINGPVYLTNGVIGSPEGNDQLFRRSNDSCFLITDPGFGILTFLDASHATFTFFRVSDMAILDQIHITKDR